MSRSRRDLVVAYLTRGAPANGAAPTVRETAPDTMTDAAALYGKWCAACHGTRGAGDGPNARYLPVRPAIHASAEQMSARSDDALFDAIAGGGAIMGKSARMPAFGGSLSTSQIHALVRYIRTLCSCAGPAWSANDAQ
jgi:mono/diheme cytochrome c family protein